MNGVPTAAFRHRPASLFCTACAVSLISIAVFFRVWHLSNVPGVNGDEAFWGIKAMHLLRGEQTGWRSNSGNLADLFYLFPLLGLHVLFAPSVVLLRSVAVLTGVLLLPVNFVLCRRVFGRLTAWLSTALLAVLPVNIAYSRFGWEPSQSVLADTIVLYLCLMLAREETHAVKRSVLSVLAWMCACVVHPTNVFLGPFVLLAILLRVQRSGWARRHAMARTVLYSVIVFTLAGFFALMPRLLTNWPHSFRLTEFVVGCLRLFSGVTVYHYIAGSTPSALWAWDVLTGAAFVLAILSILFLGSRDASTARADRLLLLGGMVSLLGFYAVTGSFAVAPSHERYALWMIAPGVLLLARGAALAANAAAWYRPVVLTAAAATGSALLIGFYGFYFQFIQATGGQAHETFRTAATEPKRAALDYILAHRTASPAFVVASEWWNYQPLFYFASTVPDAHVLTLEEWNRSLSSSQRVSAVRSGTVWFAEFDDSASAANLRGTLNASHVPFEQPTINDYAGKPVLALIHPLPR